jgi:hypothetical protein
LSLLLLICCITFSDLHMVNHPCIPRIKPISSWSMMFLICCQIWFANYFLYSFIHLCIHCWGHFSPLHRLLPPSSSIPIASRQNLFCPFFQYCQRKDISNNKKYIVLLLVEIKIAIQRDS